MQKKVFNMLKCEQVQSDFKKILSSIPDKYYIKIHGSFRYPVYPGWKRALQNNKDLHLLYVWGGEGCYHMADDTDINLREGTLVFVSHNVPHKVSFNHDNPLKIAGLRFDIYDRSDRKVTQKIVPSFYYSYNFKNYHELNNMTWKIHQLFHKHNDQISLNVCSMLVYQLIYELYQTTCDLMQQKNVDPKIEMIRQSIESQAFHRINIQRLANEYRMSTRYLQKHFKEAYSFTPKEYHKNIQMNIAYTLLTQNSVPVFKVAEMIGYCDTFAFSKQFKKHFGFSPSQAVKKCIPDNHAV